MENKTVCDPAKPDKDAKVHPFAVQNGLDTRWFECPCCGYEIFDPFTSPYNGVGAVNKYGSNGRFKRGSFEHA